MTAKRDLKQKVLLEAKLSSGGPEQVPWGAPSSVCDVVKPHFTQLSPPNAYI